VLLVGCGGLVADAIATLSLRKVSDAVGGDVTVPTDFTTAPDEGGTFRWDPVEGQYVLNVQTRPLSVGTWELIVALDDGTAWSTYLGLK